MDKELIMISKKIKSCQTALCHLIIKDRIWFASATYNALFYYDLEEDNLVFVGKFPNEEDNRSAMFANMFFYNDRIFFFPYSAMMIHIYNIRTDCFERQIRVSNDTYWKFATGVKVNNFIYLFSAQTAEISTFNLNSQNVEVIGKVNCDNESYVMSFWNNCYNVRENVFTCLSERPAIVKINTLYNKIDIKKIGKGSLGYVGTIRVNDEILFVQRDTGKIYSWEGESKYFFDRESFPESCIEYLLRPRKYGCFYGQINQKSGIVIPDSGSWVMRLYVNGEKIQLVDYEVMRSQNVLDGQLNSRIQMSDKTVSFVSGMESDIWIYGLKNKTIKKSIMTPENFFENNYNNYVAYATEDIRICTLDKFVNSIKKTQRNCGQSNIGQNIYISIRDKI